MVASGAAGILRSPLAVRFAAAYLAVLLPTLAVKYLLLSTLYVGGLGAVIQPIVHVGGSLPGWIYAVLFFTRDLLEVALMVAVLVVAAHLLRDRGGDGLLYGGVVTLVGALALNHLSSRQLGTLLTIDIAQTSLTWLRGDPATILHFITPRRVAALVATLAWALIPVALSRRASRPAASTGALWAALPSLTAGLLLAAALLQGLLASSPPGVASPLQGYWSRSLFTFVALDDRAPSAGPFSSAAEIKDA